MPSQDEANSLGPLLAAIAIGGLFAGSLDIFVASAINHVSPATIRPRFCRQSRAASTAGPPTMAGRELRRWDFCFSGSCRWRSRRSMGQPACDCPR